MFTEPGSLGLKLNEVEGTGRAKVVKVNAGSQGEQHPQTVGMLVKSVGGMDVSGMSYKEVLGILKSKAKERPLTLCFEAVPQAAEPATAAEQEPDPAAVGRPRSMSKASKKAQGGGADDHEETKRRQRQFSLSHPDFAPPPSSAPASAPAAAASKPKVSRRTSVYTESHPDFAAAAAAALVDESSEEDEIPGQ